MDDLTDKQIAELRELCEPAGGDRLQQLATLGLVAFGMMLDSLQAGRKAAGAAPKPKKG